MGIWLVFVPATSSSGFFSRETHSPVCYHLLPPSRNIRAFFYTTLVPKTLLYYEKEGVFYFLSYTKCVSSEWPLRLQYPNTDHLVRKDVQPIHLPCRALEALCCLLSHLFGSGE